MKIIIIKPRRSAPPVSGLDSPFWQLFSQLAVIKIVLYYYGELLGKYPSLSSYNRIWSFTVGIARSLLNTTSTVQ